MRSGIDISLGGGRLGIDFQPARHIERRILAVQLHRLEHALVIRAEIGLCPYFHYFQLLSLLSDVGPEADAARREARATSHLAVRWDRLLAAISYWIMGSPYSRFRSGFSRGMIHEAARRVRG